MKINENQWKSCFFSLRDQVEDDDDQVHLAQIDHDHQVHLAQIDYYVQESLIINQSLNYIVIQLFVSDDFWYKNPVVAARTRARGRALGGGGP